MDTLRLIKINENQLYAELNSESIKFSQKITINLSIDSIKSESRKITHDILNSYIKNGSSRVQLERLKKSANLLFQLLDFFKLEQYFNQAKRANKNHYLHLIIDNELNFIPFEILYDGKDFLSDFLILSREFTNTNIVNDECKISSNNKFSIVVNPSESDDIKDDVTNEANHIANIVDSNFDLRGPFKNRNVDKVELIKLLGSSSLFHFSGHYANGGWKLFDDTFQTDDILKCSKSSDFIFSNSCGHYTQKFMNFISSFLNKGTKTIVCSLGNLPSNKASEFSSIFYKYFIHYGYDAGKSLFLTKKQMIKKNGYKDIIWCFYQLYGSSLLSINKKNNLISQDSKSMITKSLFIISFILISIIAYNYIFNSNKYQAELKIRYNSNINPEIKDTTLIMGDVYNFFPIHIGSKDIKNKYYPLSLKCDSIINGKPYFSLNNGLMGTSNKQKFQLILDNADSNLETNQMIIKYPYKFDEDLLTTFFLKQDNFDRLELFFEDDIEYSVYLRYGKREFKEFFTLHIVSGNNLSYKIDLNELLQIPLPIHKDHLSNYIDKFPTDFPRNSEFELIKKDFKFKNNLIIDIKKALID